MFRYKILNKVIVQVWGDGVGNRFIKNITLNNRRFESIRWAEDYIHYLETLAKHFLLVLEEMISYNTGMGTIHDVLYKKLSKENLNPLEIEVIIESCKWEYYKNHPDNTICQIITHPIYVTEIVYGWERIKYDEDV